MINLPTAAAAVEAGRPLRVAMVVYDDISFDSRIQREASSLARDGHDVTIFCQGYRPSSVPMLDARVRVEVVTEGMRPATLDAPSPIVTNTGLRRFPARFAYLRAYRRNLVAWGRAVARSASTVDVWHAHDFTGLVAASIARTPDAALVYDMHDLFLDTAAGVRLPGALRSLLEWYERRLVRRADLMLTVNEAIAAHIRTHLRPPCEVIAVHNCVPRWPIPEPRPTLIRDALGLAPAVPVILYHGAIVADRGLETLYDAILEPGLERAHVVLLGFGPDRDRLQQLADEPAYGGRVHFLDAVLPSELLPWVASADVGALAMPQVTTNLFLSTPNKLFECLAAGTPVVVSDFPVVHDIVLDARLGPLGATCDPSSVADVARALRELLDAGPDAGEAMRRRCADSASTRWNWESEAARLTDAYRLLAAARSTERTT